MIMKIKGWMACKSKVMDKTFGDTLGICAGISFYGISEDMVGCMVAGVNWILRSKKEKGE